MSPEYRRPRHATWAAQCPLLSFLTFAYHSSSATYCYSGILISKEKTNIREQRRRSKCNCSGAANFMNSKQARL